MAKNTNRGTKTYAFGMSRRESHDSSEFYNRSMYKNGAPAIFGPIAGATGGAVTGAASGWTKDVVAGSPSRAITGPVSDATAGQASGEDAPEAALPAERRLVEPRPLEEWADRVYCHTSEDMKHVPDESVGLAFTSPPYNAGKTYDLDLDLGEYLGLIGRVAAEVYRTLVPGGRYVVNIANLGRKPYIPMHAYFYAVHMEAGFLPAGEIIWQKGKGMSGSCAWGSWMSAKAPRLRDLHEYLLVFVKGDFARPDDGESTFAGKDEFMAATLSVWDIPPERAKKVGHPAPFPVALAERVIRLYSYAGDVVLDPFCGSGTTCVAARQNGRHFVGYDIKPEYCALAEQRLARLPL